MPKYLIAGHSNITRNTPLTVVPKNTRLLLPTKCLHFGKASHNKLFSTFFHNEARVKKFFENNPAGFFKPGNVIQNVMIKAQGPRNKLVHGVIKLPIPSGANLSNRNKVNEKGKKYKYNVQPLSVTGTNHVGNIRLSEILKGRPGNYIGDFCRIAQGVHYDPKRKVLFITNPNGTEFKFLNNNLRLKNPKSTGEIFTKYNGPINVSHVRKALELELARGPPISKNQMLNFLKTLSPKVPNSNSNNNGNSVVNNNEYRLKKRRQ